MKFFKGPVSCLCHGWLVHLFIMPIRRPYTCKWQKRSFPPNKSISQALYQTLQTKKMNFETLVYKFHLQLCPSVPPIYLADFLKTNLTKFAAEEKKTMVALLIFLIATFGQKKTVGRKRSILVITFSKILLEHPSKWAATSKWHSLKDWQNYLETSSRFLKPYLTKFAVIWVKRRQKADFLSPRSSKIVGTKEKERSKSEEKERRRRVKSNGCTLSFYNSYFGQKKMLNVKGPFGNTF